MYLELANGAVYDKFMDKIDEGTLRKQEVEDYIQYYLELGFLVSDVPCLEENWQTFREGAK